MTGQPAEDFIITCLFPGCGKDAKYSGLCQAHYKFWYRYRDSANEVRRNKAKVIDAYRVKGGVGRGHKYSASLQYNREALDTRAMAWAEYQEALRTKVLEDMVTSDSTIKTQPLTTKKKSAAEKPVNRLIRRTQREDRVDIEKRNKWRRMVGAPNCNVDGCDAVGVVNGLCHVHAFQAQQQGGK